VPTGHLNLTDVLPFFAGSIPESLGQLKKLMHLLLYGNQLSGRLLTYMIFVLPYDNLIFTDFPRRNHPRILGKPGKFDRPAAGSQQAYRCIF
jgi:hypothetical protein